MGDLASSKIPSEDRHAQQSEVPKRTQKAPKADDVISTVTEDSFISFRKKFHFPNDLVMKVPARTDRACFPPPGYVTVYEFSLRAGLRFPPSSELIDILTLLWGMLVSIFLQSNVDRDGPDRAFQRPWSCTFLRVPFSDGASL
ncbi:hypothetical protein IEQ34_014852 [Dendrobium chrysotoxum]|uniref:Uncharacterized protein n=1 Tax=Dendrobium chrysotoxum TaxID=161865 RepID=A0AAV7G4G0_DENCH|nr:hypothetical protein IEQ34_014852 [Dendrobium chrysotoxum]